MKMKIIKLLALAFVVVALYSGALAVIATIGLGIGPVAQQRAKFGAPPDARTMTMLKSLGGYGAVLTLFATCLPEAQVHVVCLEYNNGVCIHTETRHECRGFIN